MRISELLKPDRVACCQDSASKKRSLEILSKLLADALPGFTEGEVFNSLIGRERLGSTGLGKGVALPHGRVKGLRQPIGAVITLSQSVDFDAIDNSPVDLMFGLLVPEESTDEHLQILARLAEMFISADFCKKLRSCDSNEQCYKLIVDWDTQQQLSA